MYIDPVAASAYVTRAVLFDQIWAQPMTKLAVIYRVSATALVKACRKAAIPVPPQGYWNKLAYGKPVVKRPSLPPAPPGYSATVTIQPSSPPLGIDPVVDARAKDEKKPENHIQVPDQLRNPHPLVQDVAASLSKATRDGRGMVSTSADPSVFKMRVSPAEKPRALRIMDAFIKALEKRGYAVSAAGVTIEGQRVALAIEEKETRTPHVVTRSELAAARDFYARKPPSWDYAPGGGLTLWTNEYVWWRKDLRKRWSDGRSTKLEVMLNDMLIGIVAIGAALRQRADEQRREAEERAEQERLRQERARQVRLEQARQKLLISSSEAWEQSRSIRAFLTEIDRRITASDTAVDADIQAWTAWAARVVDTIDPLTVGLGKFVQEHEKCAEEAAAEQPKSLYRYG